MKAARTLHLRRERLGELSTEDLRDLAGANNGTDTCTCTTVSTLTICGQICDLVDRTSVIALPTGYTPCYTLLCR